LEGCDHALIEILSQHLPGVTEEKHDNASHRLAMSQPRYEPSTSRALPLDQPALIVNRVRHKKIEIHLTPVGFFIDRLCGVVVWVPGYRSRGPGFHSPHYQAFLRPGGSGAGSTQPHADN
jgi:hypothetical protein